MTSPTSEPTVEDQLARAKYELSAALQELSERTDQKIAARAQVAGLRDALAASQAESESLRAELEALRVGPDAQLLEESQPEPAVEE